MTRWRVGVLVLASSIALAACGRVSRDAPDASRDAGAGGGGDILAAEDASVPTAGTASTDAAVDAGPTPCTAAPAGTLTWGKGFDPPDGAYSSGAPQGLTRCGDGLCSLDSTGVLRKLTLDGASVWTRNIGGQSSTDRFGMLSLAADASGRLIVGGYCTGQPTLIGANGAEPLLGCGDDTNHPQVVVARFDASGLFVSAQLLGTSEDYPPPIRVAAQANGRSAVFTLAGGPPHAYESNGLVIAWAADGTESYRHLFAGGAPIATDLAFDSKGNAVLAGFFGPTTSEDAADPDAGTPLDTAGSQLCVMKLSAQGALIWSSCFDGDNQNDLEPALALGPDDSIVLSGTFVGQLDFDAVGKGAPPSPTRLTTVGPYLIGPNQQPDFDLYAAKLTADGDFVWQRRFGSALDQQGPFGLAVTPEGHVILDATTRGAFDVGPFHIDAETSGDGFILELDDQGEPTFLTLLKDSRYLSAHDGIALGDCHDFYATSNFEGSFHVLPGSEHADVFLVAGQY